MSWTLGAYDKIQYQDAISNLGVKKLYQPTFKILGPLFMFICEGECPDL